MMLAVFAVCFVTVCLLVAVSLRLRTLLTPRTPKSDLLPAQDAGVSAAQFYRPMQRLLADEDFLFLSERPEISPAEVSRMRAERRRIFRQYLAALSTDFADLTSRLRAIMVESPHSREDLALAILKSRMLFSAALIVIEGRLLLHACGLYRIQISAGNLIEGLTQMQRELEQFSRVPALSVS